MVLKPMLGIGMGVIFGRVNYAISMYNLYITSEHNLFFDTIRTRRAALDAIPPERENVPCVDGNSAIDAGYNLVACFPVKLSHCK